jgi:hypothetical protein
LLQNLKDTPRAKKLRLPLPAYYNAAAQHYVLRNGQPG